MIYQGGPVVGFGDACPGNPPPPDGYEIWRGPVPPELTQWAESILANIRESPRGTTWSTEYNDEIVLGRHDAHPWTYRNGVLVTGCFEGVTLYRPAGVLGVASTESSPEPPEKTDWGLVVICAAAIATVAGGFALALRPPR